MRWAHFRELYKCIGSAVLISEVGSFQGVVQMYRWYIRLSFSNVARGGKSINRGASPNYFLEK